MSYLNYGPTLHESVGGIILRHSRTNTWRNIQRKFDKPVMCLHLYLPTTDRGDVHSNGEVPA
jgi:hypothetical protein